MAQWDRKKEDAITCSPKAGGSRGPQEDPYARMPELVLWVMLGIPQFGRAIVRRCGFATDGLCLCKAWGWVSHFGWLEVNKRDFLIQPCSFPSDA